MTKKIAYDVFKFHDYYTKDMYSERNRIKNLVALAVPNCAGLAVLLGTPVNRAEGARRLQTMEQIQIGYFEMVWRNHSQPNGPFLHIQADVRRADNEATMKALQGCVNWENTLAANGHTEHVKFLIRERKSS